MSFKIGDKVHIDSSLIKYKFNVGDKVINIHDEDLKGQTGIVVDAKHIGWDTAIRYKHEGKERFSLCFDDYMLEQEFLNERTMKELLGIK